MSQTWDPATAFDLLDRVGHAYALMAARTEALVADLDVTSSELVALFVLLAHADGLSQSDWGRLQGVSRQRAHSVTKRLVGAGLVHRAPRGRASTITLTPAGRALAEAQRARIGAQAFAALDTLGPDRALRLHADLGRLIAALGG